MQWLQQHRRLRKRHTIHGAATTTSAVPVASVKSGITSARIARKKTEQYAKLTLSEPVIKFVIVFAPILCCSILCAQFATFSSLLLSCCVGLFKMRQLPSTVYRHPLPSIAIQRHEIRRGSSHIPPTQIKTDRRIITKMKIASIAPIFVACFEQTTTE